MVVSGRRRDWLPGGAGLHEAELNYLRTPELALAAEGTLWRSTSLGLHLDAAVQPSVHDSCGQRSMTPRPRAAFRLVRAFDMQNCANCGCGELGIIASMLERLMIDKMLAPLGMQSRPPGASARTGRMARTKRQWAADADADGPPRREGNPEPAWCWRCRRASGLRMNSSSAAAGASGERPSSWLGMAPVGVPRGPSRYASGQNCPVQTVSSALATLTHLPRGLSPRSRAAAATASPKPSNPGQRKANQSQ